MLHKLFLMRKRFVTFVEELLLQNRSVTNAEQFISHEEELLLQNRFVTNAEQFISYEEELLLQNRFVTNAEQFIIYMFLSRSALVVIFLKAKMSFCSFCRRVSFSRVNFSNDISIGTEA